MPVEKTIKRGMSLFLFAVLQPLITCPGCSVKEDRDQCPCILRIEYAEDDAEMLEKGIGICLDGKFAANGLELLDVGRDLASERSFTGGKMHLDTAVTIISGLEVSLKAWRGDLDVLSLYPADAERMEEDGECWFRIREGSSCPEIWTAHSSVNTGSDRAVVNCNLRKNHCLLRIIFNGTGSYRIRARGGVCGYGYDGEPYPGSFLADAETDEDGSIYVCVPRQKDNSLMLDMISEDGGVRSFAIGNYLAESGYDWNSDDLHDAAITIDYNATSVTFTIDKWSRTLQFETVI